MLANVLDLLAGRYPSEEFAELRPRIVWDRTDDTLRGRAGAQRLAVTSGGTIPDRGLYGVFLPDGTRVGELDEEMVYESRVGETFLLGASTCRIEEITFERVVVTPAPGQPGKMPFWHGDGPGRPLELGRALGQFVREVRADDDPMARLRARNGLDEWAASNLIGYLDEQAEATGAVPDDRTIVVERFRDEIGDWRVCILSPFGAQVHAPWAMALQHRLGEQWGVEVELMWSDDGIVLRLPEAIDELPLDELAIDPEEIDELIVSQLPNTAMFASRFRECAGRALLLPRRRPDQRTPLWQQRQRAADLLRVASHHPTFPILLEATSECVNDVFDVPALREVLTDLRARRAPRPRRDPPGLAAQSLLFGWIAVYVIRAARRRRRRRAAATLDRDRSVTCSAPRLRPHRPRCARRPRNRASAWTAPGATRGARPTASPRSTGAEIDLPPTATPGRWSMRCWTSGGHGAISPAKSASPSRTPPACATPGGVGARRPARLHRPGRGLSTSWCAMPHPRALLAGQVAAWLGVTVDPVRVVLGSRTPGPGHRGEFRPTGSAVVRRRRAAPAAPLPRRPAKEVEVVDAASPLPQWRGGPPRRGVGALAEVGLLQGAPAGVGARGDLLRPHGVLLPGRPRCPHPQAVVWSVPARSGHGRARPPALPDQVSLLCRRPPPPRPPRACATSKPAAFVSGGWSPPCSPPTSTTTPPCSTPMWDLVWAGGHQRLLAPLRAMAGSKRGKGGKAGSAGGRRRPRPGRLTRLGPPEAAGRWSLVAPLLLPAATPTEAAHARAQQLLHRYGVLTREAALGEGAEGGFAGVYPVLKALEERGNVRRGYFVSGLGAAQFALPGAVDRLRAVRSSVDQGRGFGDAESACWCWRRRTRRRPAAPPARTPGSGTRCRFGRATQRRAAGETTTPVLMPAPSSCSSTACPQCSSSGAGAASSHPRGGEAAALWAETRRGCEGRALPIARDRQGDGAPVVEDVLAADMRGRGFVTLPGLVLRA